MPLDLSGESGRLALRARDDDDGSVLNVEQSTAEHGRRRPRTTTTPRHRDAPDSPSPSLPPTRWLAFALLWGLWGGPPEAFPSSCLCLPLRAHLAGNLAPSVGATPHPPPAPARPPRHMACD